MEKIRIPEQSVPVLQEADIVVIGGGCTGTFAAIRAARLGAKVALVEESNAFGGVATNGFVCVWHALTDTTYKKQIIGGLTDEAIQRLKRVPNGIHIQMPPEGDNIPFRDPIYSIYHLNTEELKIELDSMVMESGVTPYLHTTYSAPYMVDGELRGVIVQNRSSIGCILGKFFIDASADGFLAADVGVPVYYHETMQPATTGARIWGWNLLTAPNDRLRSAENRERLGFRPGWDWSIPGVPDVRNWFKSQYVQDCSDPHLLTLGEIEGRAQVRKIMDILREQDPNGNELALIGLSSVIGIRETRQLKCSYQLTLNDVCYGRVFDDAIAYGAYPMDIHTPKMPTVLRHLDGTEQIGSPSYGFTYGRWRTDEGPYPTYWQIPYRSLLPEKVPNLLICGRSIDTDKSAHGATRVMISLNQTGEACGVACYEALTSGKSVQEIDIAAMRNKMRAGGSILF